MCDPVSIASAAAMAGGSLYNMQQQRDYVQRQNAANDDAAAYARMKWDAEKARQDEMSRSARAIADTQAERGTLASQQALLDEQTAQRQTSYSGGVPAVEDPNRVSLLPTQGTDQVVRDQAAKDLADYLGKARGQIAARAQLEAFGGLQNDNNLATALANSALGQNAGFRQASMGLNQRETSIPAAQVGAPDMTIGNVLTTAGGLGLYAGARGWNPFGGAGGANINVVGAGDPGMALNDAARLGKGQYQQFVY